MITSFPIIQLLQCSHLPFLCWTNANIQIIAEDKTRWTFSANRLAVAALNIISWMVVTQSEQSPICFPFAQ